MNTKVCTGVAYEWLLETEPNPNGHDFTLIIATCRVQLGSDDSAERNHRVYHAKFPPLGQPFQLVDVSGTLGLLWQTTEPKAQEKAAAFERMLADATLWTFEDIDFTETKLDEGRSMQHIVLVQGPLIPKLRGRYLYRGIDSRLAVYSLTFDPEWFRRMEAAQTMFARLQSSDKSQVSNVYPPTGIDRATRSWVCRLPCVQNLADYPLHFEVIANMWDCCGEASDAEWLDQRRKEIAELTGTQNLESVGKDEDVRLPRALAVAVREARSFREREDQFSKALRLAQDCLSVAGAVDRTDPNQIRAIFGDGFAEGGAGESGHADFFALAATRNPATLDCDAGYQHFLSKWPDKDFRKSVEKFLSKKRSGGKP